MSLQCIVVVWNVNLQQVIPYVFFGGGGGGGGAPFILHLAMLVYYGLIAFVLVSRLRTSKTLTFRIKPFIQCFVFVKYHKFISSYI